MIDSRERDAVKLILLTLLSLAPAWALAATSECGSLNNTVGPWDYTHPSSRRLGYQGNNKLSQLKVVEDFHFYAQIKDLDGDPKYLLGDLDYTLRAFPNHHAALYAVSKLERKLGQLPSGKNNRDWRRTAACYFSRALQFRPNDPTVWMIQGIHLQLIDQKQEALTAYLRSEELYPHSADLHYNMGLLYTELENFEQAKSHAVEAYRMGHRQQALRDRLEAAGHWP